MLSNLTSFFCVTVILKSFGSKSQIGSYLDSLISQISKLVIGDLAHKKLAPILTALKAKFNSMQLRTAVCSS